MYTLDISGSTQFTVSSGHFGANTLTHIDQVSSSSGYSDLLETLNVNNLRFPGGTVTEQAFDVTDYDADYSSFDGGLPLTPLSTFLEFINDNNLSSSFVIPTRKLLLGDCDPSSSVPRALDFEQIDATLELVTKLLSESDPSLPNASISAIEIGNEYWGAANMTTAEYALVVDYLVPRIKEIVDRLAGEGDLVTGTIQPGIIVQVGQPWAPEFKAGGYLELPPHSTETTWKWDEKISYVNEIITSNLSDTTKVAIDGVVHHYYLKDNGGEGGQWGGQHFESVSMSSSFDHWISQPGLENIDFHVTEWNVNSQSYDQLGMKAASNNLQQFENMLRAGVDSAQIWAVQHNTTNDLSGRPGENSGLTTQGAVFALMSDVLVGSTLLDDNYFGQEFEVSAYQNTSVIHVFVTLRSDAANTITLNMDDLLGEEFLSAVDFSIQATLVGVDQATSDGMHFVRGAGMLPVEIYNEHDVLASITELSAEHILDSDGNIVLSLDPYEVVRIDVTFQGENAKYGSAIELEGTGNSDFLFAGAGDDWIRGLAGNDYIDGNEGNDILDGGAGIDRLLGGSGADVFVFADDSGLDIVYDFEDGVDRIALFGSDEADFDEIQITQYGDGGSLIQLGDSLMIVRGTLPEQITIDDFVFLNDEFVEVANDLLF
ncbi:Hemolysin-type calcium-binding repeat-containing protein [Yoonia tamlensis]|uniref:Hemolysin-type calcium-binding repeat-containing protein n=1 Tax=Yoonia tamlensis TaxID=390270 RepID=A0A1I6GDT5_9RHOB|nr:hypothetical protein [Yoonia tamlensis]SFR40349.1 Hemolysin-type calcium-binding repeat-containing protein [Yoonia tamlensis]